MVDKKKQKGGGEKGVIRVIINKLIKMINLTIKFITE